MEDMLEEGEDMAAQLQQALQVRRVLISYLHDFYAAQEVIDGMRPHGNARM